MKVLTYLDRTEDYYDALTVPMAVTIVTSRMVARVLEQASAGIVPGVQQQGATTGPFSSQTTFVSGSTSGGPWLAAGDKQMLKPYRSGGGMASVQVTTGRTGAYLREA